MIKKQQVYLLLDHNHNKVESRPIALVGEEYLGTSLIYIKSIVPTEESCDVAAVAEWYRYRIMACLVMSSSPVSLKTRHVGQRCMLNLSRAETASRWCGAVVSRGGASSGVVHVT
ncbi:uncharacterized protein TNCV_567201 [Trichonephila clavipes]|nr:uncharacterized protein TNCV_567201 [Trichonephila clavipes]